MDSKKNQSNKKILNPSEKAIETAILMYLNGMEDCFAWKNNSTGIYDTAKGKFRKARGKFLITGVSDILGIFKGRLLAIEVKRPTNKRRPPEQVSFIKKINKHGGIAGFCTSIEDVIDLLQGEDNECNTERLPE